MKHRRGIVISNAGAHAKKEITMKSNILYGTAIVAVLASTGLAAAAGTSAMASKDIAFERMKTLGPCNV